MDEPELRVGGWVQQKKRGKIRRLFSFLLIVAVSLLVGGPMLVDYKETKIKDSLYLSAGVWNGPFEKDNTKEFNGHLKISRTTYESLDGGSGKLIVLSISSLVSLEYFNMHDINVKKVKDEMNKEGLELTTTGKIASEVNDNLPANTNIYQWNAEATSDSTFFENNENVFVKVFSWNSVCESQTICTGKTIICIALGKDQNYINQATEIIENVR